jgi:peptidyl-prolyl cis-trans isomerase SurA
MRPADVCPTCLSRRCALAVGKCPAQPVRSGAGFHILKLLDRLSDDPYKVTQTRARHILMRHRRTCRPPRCGRRLETLRAQIERGERRFEDVAREVSEDGSAAGGDLGWASPGSFVPEFEEAMNRLPLGGISPPVVSRFGVHLIQVMERRRWRSTRSRCASRPATAARAEVRRQAYGVGERAARRAYVELREPPQ